MNAKRQPPRPSSIDPAVADLLGEGQRRSAERSMPTASRTKLLREREKARKRNRIVWDISAATEERIQREAAVKGCPVSQAAEALLLFAIANIDAGRWSLYEVPSEPSKSPRYICNLLFEETDFSPARDTPSKKQGHP